MVSRARILLTFNPKKEANAVAEELAVEHCSFYGDSTSKAVKGFFLNQVYRSWGHTAHRGWARFLLDRRSFVQVPNAPRRRARAVLRVEYHGELYPPGERPPHWHRALDKVLS